MSATKNPSTRPTVSLEPTVVAARDVPSYQHAPTWPDVRGWEVMDAGGKSVGVVDRLMIDPTIHRIRYLSVRAAVTGGTPAPQTLVPVGAAQVEPGRNRVQLSGKATTSWSQLTKASTEVVTRDTEIALLRALGFSMLPSEPATMTYASPLFDPRHLFEPGPASRH